MFLSNFRLFGSVFKCKMDIGNAKPMYDHYYMLAIRINKSDSCLVSC